MRKYLVWWTAVLMSAIMLVSVAPLMVVADDTDAEDGRIWLTKMDFEAGDNYTGWKLGKGTGYGTASPALTAGNTEIKGNTGSRYVELGDGVYLNKIFQPIPNLKNHEKVVFEMKVKFTDALPGTSYYFFDMYAPGDIHADASYLSHMTFSGDNIHFVSHTNAQYAPEVNTEYILKIEMNFVKYTVIYRVLSGDGKTILKEYSTNFGRHSATPQIEDVAGFYMRSDQKQAATGSFDVDYIYMYAEQSEYDFLYDEEFNYSDSHTRSGWVVIGMNSVPESYIDDGRLKIYDCKNVSPDLDQFKVRKEFSPSIDVSELNNIFIETEIEYTKNPYVTDIIEMKGYTEDSPSSAVSFIRLGMNDGRFTTNNYSYPFADANEQNSFQMAVNKRYIVKFEVDLVDSRYRAMISGDGNDFVSKWYNTLVSDIKSITDIILHPKDTGTEVITYFDYWRIYTPKPEPPSYLAEEFVFTVGGDEVDDFKTDDSVKVSVDITNNLEKDLPIVMVVCLLDSDGMIINADFGSLDTSRTAATPGVSSFTKTVTITDDVESIRAFLWDGFDKMEPYTISGKILRYAQ